MQKKKKTVKGNLIGDFCFFRGGIIISQRLQFVGLPLSEEEEKKRVAAKRRDFIDRLQLSLQLTCEWLQRRVVQTTGVFQADMNVQTCRITGIGLEKKFRSSVLVLLLLLLLPLLGNLPVWNASAVTRF